ncbi:DUF5818 domain-containing protein [Ralstonia pickettii]|uniref:DUF5818 domain-containing protein n=1 Tax=Ralstonia pickettii TaxID=329 RepID=UPI0015BEDCCE|nr:DUF5818 domain-containing protein [Ralstonia pickettii]NWK44124.1 hypothetical protein [Ralstonia pickettii]
MQFSRLFSRALISALLAACSFTSLSSDITLQGTLSQVGNFPFNYLALRTEDGALWKLDVSDENVLLPLVNQRVIVSGTPGSDTTFSAFSKHMLHVRSIKPVKR